MYPLNSKIKRTLAGGAPAFAVSGITPVGISIAPAEFIVLQLVPLLTKPFGQHIANVSIRLYVKLCAVNISRGRKNIMNHFSCCRVFA